MNYSLAVYIGRFQPFHKGHFQTLLSGFELASRVLVLVGSHPSERTIKNPFTFQEREQMILESVEPHKATHCLNVCPIQDEPSDAVWANRVANIVRDYEKNDSKITIIGDHSDPDSKYLKLFTWDVIGKENLAGVHATAIRSLFLSGKLEQIASMIPVSTYNFLKNFEKSRITNYYTERYLDLRELYKEEERRNDRR